MKFLKYLILTLVSCGAHAADRERATQDVIIVYDLRTSAHLMTAINAIDPHDKSLNPPNSMQFTIPKEIYNRMPFPQFQAYAESHIPRPVHSSDGQ